MLRRALCAGNKMIGYLDSPCYGDTDFTELDHSIFDLIADLCGLCMERDGGYGQVPDNMLEFFLTDLMEGRLTNEPLIEERLRYFHFPLHTPLTILSARLLDEELPSVSRLKDICLCLTAAFPLFTCFSYNDQIKCIIPPGAEGVLSRSMVKKLEDTLRAEHLIAGVSRPLEALKDFAVFNRQSENSRKRRWNWDVCSGRRRPCTFTTIWLFSMHWSFAQTRSTPFTLSIPLSIRWRSTTEHMRRTC